MTRRMLLAGIVLSFALAIFAGEGGIRRTDKKIVGEYIVTLRSDIAPTEVGQVAEALARSNNGTVIVTLENGIKGFGAAMSETDALKLSRHPLVDAVEENGEVGLSYTSIELPTDNSLWALDRIDQRGTIATGTIPRYYAYTATGNGVRAYVVDYGIHAAHDEFRNGNPTLTCSMDPSAPGNRVEIGANFNLNPVLPPSEQDSWPANNPCGGWYPEPSQSNHGTAVASILGGSYSGVAKTSPWFQ